MTVPAVASTNRMSIGKHEEVTTMEKRNVYTFVDGAETTTMKFGRLDTGRPT